MAKKRQLEDSPIPGTAAEVAGATLFPELEGEELPSAVAIGAGAASAGAESDDPKRDLLEAFLPDIFTSDHVDWLWDSLSILGQFAPEELQRLQVATLLLILERQYAILEELKRLRWEGKAHRSESGPKFQRNGGQSRSSEAEGFDATYFRERILRELGEEPDDQTLEVLLALAGEPGRLDRAITSTKRYVEQHQVAKPLGFLVAKLRSWREEDRSRQHLR